MRWRCAEPLFTAWRIVEKGVGGAFGEWFGLVRCGKMGALVVVLFGISLMGCLKEACFEALMGGTVTCHDFRAGPVGFEGRQDSRVTGKLFSALHYR